MLYSNKDLKKLIIPLLIEQILIVAVGMVDTLMISGAGEAAVSGVSLVDNINILVINIFAALATGGAVVVGHFLGEKDEKSAGKAAWQLVYAAIVISFVVAVIYMLAHNWILAHVFGKIDADVMKSAKTYLLITAVSIVPLAVYSSCAALFRAMGKSNITMWISLLMNVIHVIGNVILIYGFDMGVAGAAISTTVSRIVAAGLIFILMCRKEQIITLRGQITYRFQKTLIKKIMYIGIPSGMENSLFQLGKILLLSLVSTFGTSAIAANAVCNTVAVFNNLPGMSINYGILSVVAVCVGANDYKSAKIYTKKLIKTAYIATFACSFLLAVFAQPIVGMFHLSAEASHLAVIILRMHAGMACIFWIPSFSLPYVLRAAGDTIYPMCIAIVSMWIFRIGIAYVLSYIFHVGLIGVWIAMVIDWVFRGSCYVARYLGGKWQTKYKSETA